MISDIVSLTIYYHIISRLSMVLKEIPTSLGEVGKSRHQMLRPEQCSSDSLPPAMHNHHKHAGSGRSPAFRSATCLRDGGSVFLERRSEATELACCGSCAPASPCSARRVASSFGFARLTTRACQGVELRGANQLLGSRPARRVWLCLGADTPRRRCRR